MLHRDFTAELNAARQAEDWDAHERIWEERRLASVEADEAQLIDPEPDPTKPREVTILAARLGEARKVLDKLVKKAARYGNPDISYTVGPVFSTTEKRRDPLTDRVKEVPGPDRVTLTVAGAAPRVGPFEFRAKVDHAPTGNIVDIIPGHTVDPRFRSTESVCEHCRTSRRRKETYVLVNTETGEQVQVGSSCLLDYTGLATPAGLAQRFAFFRELDGFDEEWGSGGRYTETFSADEVLAATAVTIRLFGWCSKGQAAAEGGRVEATAYIVANFLSPPRTVKGNESIFKRNAQLRDAVRDPEDLDYAISVLDWLESGGAGDGDYGYNLKAACGRGWVEGRRLGIVCSAVQAYERAMEREVRRTKEREEAKKSVWQGVEGQRLRDVPVTQQEARCVGSSDWDSLLLVKFIDEAGNLYTWFTSGGTGLQNGEKTLLTGTVKRHTEYKGVRETQLSRCILK